MRYNSIADGQLYVEANDILQTVAEHLFAQGKPAIGSHGSCRYRTDDGCKCAFGVLIRDEEYRPNMELQPASSVIEDFHLDRFRPHKELITALQVVHDRPVSMPDRDQHLFLNEDGTFREDYLAHTLHGVAITFGLAFNTGAWL